MRQLNLMGLCRGSHGWYHIARQAAYTSIASSTDDTRGEATSTVPESQSTLQTRYLIIQQEIARL